VLVHYRLRSAPPAPRLPLRVIYRTDPTPIIDADSIRPGLFIEDGFATGISAESIGSHSWINQQVTIGFDPEADRHWVKASESGAGVIVLGPITLHDGATVGANAAAVHDVGPGEVVVGPLATPLKRRRGDGGELT